MNQVRGIVLLWMKMSRKRVPSGVIRGIIDIFNGNAATKEEIEEVLKDD